MYNVAVRAGITLVVAAFILLMAAFITESGALGVSAIITAGMSAVCGIVAQSQRM